MTDRKATRLVKWPFLAGDVLLLSVAAWIVYNSRAPLSLEQGILCAGVVALAAVFGVLPFVLEYRAAAKLAEASVLAASVAQIKNIKMVAAQINSATAQWQCAQEACDRTVAAAKDITARMTAEAEAFTEFLKKANDTEKATLRLEVEKARRAENDWLQVLVRMLDHVFALYQGAVRSDQPNLAEQVGNFQNACREAARRIGLVPFAAAPDEPFDSARHQLADADAAPPLDARVAETIATGYTFQGRLLRPALVALRTNGPVAVPDEKRDGAAGSEKPPEPPDKKLEEQPLL